MANNQPSNDVTNHQAVTIGKVADHLSGDSSKHAILLTEALPHLLEYFNQTIVIKFGGNAMIDQSLNQNFANDVVLLKHCGIFPIVVHGGGPQINETLKKLNIKTETHNGLRKTTAEVADVVEMVLSGLVNKSIVEDLHRAGGKAIGLSCKDGNIVKAKMIDEQNLGRVGTPISSDSQLITLLENSPYIPVISPVSSDEMGNTLNVNADTIAGFIAQNISAKRLLLLTSVTGALDRSGNLIPEIRKSEAIKLIKDGVFTDGMIPKIETAIEALENGVEAVTIIDGRNPHALLLEIFTNYGAGTMIKNDD